ncbi:hypothetical protein CLOM621_08452 [Clostridium sp. M62/1]|nr:hypothetical protein CLOM621_08452 [Clostridium sp. M62/1]CBK78926.1 hypothetical protein CLS_38360 [[Clostridium] cf. saccharolyticum K10]
MTAIFRSADMRRGASGRFRCRKRRKRKKGTVVKYLHTAILQQFFCLGARAEPVS